MLLVIDAGNSNVTFGVYDDGPLLFRWRIRTEADRTADEYAAFLGSLCAQNDISLGDITGIALASVVPAATPTLRRLARDTFLMEPVEVSPRKRPGPGDRLSAARRCRGGSAGGRRRRRPLSTAPPAS